MITRDRIELEEQAARLTWHTVQQGDEALKLARIELPSFYGAITAKEDAPNAAEDVQRLLMEAKRGGADGLMLDLADNSGGLLSAATRIAGLFIADGGITMTDGRRHDAHIHRDYDSSIHFAGPMVVLTSRMSASASRNPCRCPQRLSPSGDRGR